MSRWAQRACAPARRQPRAVLGRRVSAGGCRSGAAMAAGPPVLLGLRDAAMVGPCRGGGRAPAWATSKLGGSAVGQGRAGPGGGGRMAAAAAAEGPRPEGAGGRPRSVSKPCPRCSSFRTGCPPCGRALPAAGCAGGRWRTWCRCTARWRGPPSTASPTSSRVPRRGAGERPAGEDAALPFAAERAQLDGD